MILGNEKSCYLCCLEIIIFSFRSGNKDFCLVDRNLCFVCCKRSPTSDDATLGTAVAFLKLLQEITL